MDRNWIAVTEYETFKELTKEEALQYKEKGYRIITKEAFEEAGRELERYWEETKEFWKDFATERDNRIVKESLDNANIERK